MYNLILNILILKECALFSKPQYTASHTPTCYLLSTVDSNVNNYTAIFLINGLGIVYCSLLQCLTLVYLGWGQKS